MANDINKTMDSSRTDNNVTGLSGGHNKLLKSLDVGRGQLLSHEAREQSLKLLNRGGKRIDLQHSQK